MRVQNDTIQGFDHGVQILACLSVSSQTYDSVKCMYATIHQTFFKGMVISFAFNPRPQAIIHPEYTGTMESQ